MNYLVSVFPGLVGVAAEELQQVGLKAGSVMRLRNAELLPVEAATAAALMDVRVAEDVFVRLGSLRLSGGPEDLRLAGKAAVFGGGLTRALAEYVRATGKAMPARVVFRVVAQAEDAHWRHYRRVDLQVAAEEAVLRGRAGWRLMRDEAPIEVWLWQVGRELVAGLRLTMGVHRSRGGRVAEREAALRPTIAAAMVFLSAPTDDDVFLDPMCGTGTILLERAVAGRYQMLLGGDNDVRAVAATLANFGLRHQPRRIERWDVRQLPLDAASVTRLATNLPWGRQIGRLDALPALYRAVLAEAVRVVRPGGRLVLLTSEWELLKRVLKDRRGLRLVRTVENVKVLGRRADIFVIDRIA